MSDSGGPKGDFDGLEKHINLDRESTVSPPPIPPTFEHGIMHQFYRDLMDCLTEPRYFFTKRYPETTLSYAFAFGIIVNWIAAFLSWMTRAVKHETLMDGFMKMRDRLQELPFWKSLPENFWAQGNDHGSASFFPAWLAEMLSIALSPFQSLVHFCFSGFILFLGSWLLIPRKNPDANQDPIRVRQLIKLACFCSAPYLVSAILGFLPIGLGSFVGWVYSTCLLVLALQIRYQISNLRALTVLILPGILSAFAVFFVLIVFVALIFGMFAALFHS